MAKSGCIACLLNIHAKVDDIEKHLHMTLWLHVRTHDPKTHYGLAVSSHEAGHDRVKRSLAGFERVRMPGIEAEQLTAILQDESELSRRHPRTHAAEVALDQRYHVAGLVSDREINGIAACQRTRVAVAEIA